MKKMRHCWNCGAELGEIESRYYDPMDTCGSRECEREARYQAEAQRQEDQEAAIEAERQRIAAEKAAAEAEAQRREADQKHRGRVNGAAAAALVTHAGLTDEQSRAVIIAIARHQVPAVMISY